MDVDSQQPHPSSPPAAFPPPSSPLVALFLHWLSLPRTEQFLRQSLHSLRFPNEKPLSLEADDAALAEASRLPAPQQQEERESMRDDDLGLPKSVQQRRASKTEESSSSSSGGSADEDEAEDEGRPRFVIHIPGEEAAHITATSSSSSSSSLSPPLSTPPSVSSSSSPSQSLAAASALQSSSSPPSHRVALRVDTDTRFSSSQSSASPPLSPKSPAKQSPPSSASPDPSQHSPHKKRKSNNANSPNAQPAASTSPSGSPPASSTSPSASTAGGSSSNRLSSTASASPPKSPRAATPPCSPPVQSPSTSFSAAVSSAPSAASQAIRRFYYPDGQPPTPETRRKDERRIRRLFRRAQRAEPKAKVVKQQQQRQEEEKSDDEEEAEDELDDDDDAADTETEAGWEEEAATLAVGREDLYPLTTQVCGLSSYCNGALYAALLAHSQQFFPQHHQHEKQLQRAEEAEEKTAAAVLPSADMDTKDSASQASHSPSSVSSSATSSSLPSASPPIHLDVFLSYYLQHIQPFDAATRLFRVLRPSPQSRYLTRDSLKAVAAEIVSRHPGLEFLQSTPEFQFKYAQTVIARIFYTVNVSGNERLTLAELKHSNLLLMLQLLDTEDDINKLNDYFSYEHFYVIYCVCQGTLVSLADGTSVPIEQVKEGMLVLGYATATADQEEGLTPRQVQAVLPMGVKECVELLFSDGRTLTCTPDHRLRTADGRWVAAGQLVIDQDEVAVGVEYPDSTVGADPTAEWRLDLQATLGYDLNMAQRARHSPAEELAARVEALVVRAMTCQPDWLRALLRGRAAMRASPQLSGSPAVDAVTYGVHEAARVLPLFRVRLVGRRAVGAKRVYDLTVPSEQGDDTASFTANGVVVHNCKFWELDSDHDGFLDVSDLASYDEYALTSCVTERVIAGHGRPLLSLVPGKMNYLDFVIFLISEVDKSSAVSVDYWFNCLDLDGDGVITGYEMETFFEEQKQKIQNLSQEQITFIDILCQLVDMIKGGQGAGRDLLPLDSAPPILTAAASSSSAGSSSHLAAKSSLHLQPVPGVFFTKQDLRSSHLSSAFFNTLFNLNKFIISESRDPLRIKAIHDSPELSDWDRYAINGYHRLADVDADDDGGDVAEGDDAAGGVVGEEVADDAGAEEEGDRDWLERRGRAALQGQGRALAAAGGGNEDTEVFVREDVDDAEDAEEEDGDGDADTEDGSMDVDDGHSDAHMMMDSAHDEVKG